MRSVAFGVLALILASCGAKYRPGDPVLSGYDRAFKFPVHRPHEGMLYSGRQPATTAPIVPLMAFGAAYDLDFVLMPKEGDLDMIEIARIALPNGPQWIALETSASSGDQTLLANLDDLETFMPEIPVARQVSNLQTTDRSTEFTVDLSIEYTNSRGQKVTAELTGDPPTKPARHRNGRTFDHSKNQMMAVLDIASSQSLFKSDIQVDGKSLKLRKIAGIVPARFVLEQAQGGLVSAAYKVIPSDAAVGGPTLADVVLNAPGEAPKAKPSPEVLVKMGVAQNIGPVNKCWKERAAEKADLAGGKMMFDFRIDAGKVSGATVALVEGEKTFADEALGKCVAEALNGWTFDESLHASVTWPFTFVPGDAEEETDPSVQLGVGEIRVDEAPAGGGETAGAVPGDEVDPDGGPGEPIEAEGTDEEDPDAPSGAEAPPPEAGELTNFTTVQMLPGEKSVELKWLVSRQGDRVIARQTTELRSLTYSYRLVQESYLELVGITVEQYGRATPVTAITFNPPLPDVRWPFTGRRASAFVVDINGQQNYATGEAEAYWTESGPKIKVTGSAPKWVEERPLLTTITYPGDGTAEIKTERVGE